MKCLLENGLTTSWGIQGVGQDTDRLACDKTKGGWKSQEAAHLVLACRHNVGQRDQGRLRGEIQLQTQLQTMIITTFSSVIFRTSVLPLHQLCGSG